MQRQAEALLTLIKEKYPDWAGEAHSAWVEDEIAYKHAAATQFTSLLNQDEYQSLLNNQQYDDILKRLETVSKATNLLWRRLPRRGDTAILYADGLNKAEFALVVRDLLYGSAPAPDRLEGYARYAAANHLPLSWPFPTYLLFLAHPQTELFIKPEAVQWWLKFMGVGEVWTKTPGAAAYTAIRYHAHQLKQALNLPDMIAVQSLIWVAFQQAKQRTGRLSPKGQIELDVPDNTMEVTVPNYLNTDLLSPRTIQEEAMSYKTSDTQGVQYWKISPERNAILWDNWMKGSYISIGWDEIGDLSYVGRAAFDERCKKLIIEYEEWNQRALEQVWKFAQEIKIGDRVVANRGTKEIVGIGTVIDNYYFLSDTHHGHRIPVRWDDVTVRSISEPGWRRTLVQLDREKFELLKKAPLINPTPLTPTPTLRQTPSMVGVGPVQRRKRELSEVAAATGLTLETLQTWLRAIERKGQAVLYGPPGTGKTYVARHLADYLAQDTGFVTTLQFHPAYTYEDFIEGIRPQENPDGKLELKMTPGRFLSFCELARRTPSATCVLILDEINRANLSRVFGELMYLMEYREDRIFLAGSGLFGIPANVRLIGTMNTADRSIALVDHALRRRFAFLELAPNYELLRHYHQKHNPDLNLDGLIRVLERLNSQIDKHYQVGVTFFMRPHLPQELRDIWEMEILPYLDEYFFDQLERIEPFRWSRIAKEIDMA